MRNKQKIFKIHNRNEKIFKTVQHQTKYHSLINSVALELMADFFSSHFTSDLIDLIMTIQFKYEKEKKNFRIYRVPTFSA